MELISGLKNQKAGYCRLHLYLTDMMRTGVRYLERKNIDTTAWDKAIARAENGLPYAYSWYLDITCSGRWSALVAEDYKMVMPLPWNQKLFGLKQIYQPILSQQLGVFGHPISQTEMQTFIDAIPLEFKYMLLSFNEKNQSIMPQGLHAINRTNLLLHLDKPYEEIQEAYSRSLRKRLRQAGGEHRFEEIYDPGEVIGFYRMNLEKRLKLGKATYTLIENLARLAIDHGIGRLYTAKDVTGITCANGLFLVSHGRIFNVFGSSSDRGKDLNSMHFLLDAIIKKYAEQDFIFDFEGSEIPSIASFFKSFGAEDSFYSLCEINRLPFPLRLIKSLRRV